MHDEPILYPLELYTDDRGVLRATNILEVFKDPIKRFYHVSNHNPNTIRAWHGHEYEAKWVYVVRGAIMFAAFPMGKSPEMEMPGAEGYFRVGDHLFLPKDEPDRWVLSAHKPQLLYVPPMYANGWKALTTDVDVMYFSDKHYEECKHDDYRFGPELFGHIWKVESR